MPVKNRSEYLKESISSIIKQTFKEWELIIIDDHSKEKIKKVIDSFKDPRIKSYKLPKGAKGIASARNYGTKKAEANLIVVADSDDWNYPNRLKVTYDYFQKYPDTDVFYSNINIYSIERKNKKTMAFQPYKKELIYYVNFIPHPASAYTKKAWQKVRGYDSRMVVAEDYNLWIKMSNKNMVFGCIKKPLVLKRSHSGSIIKKHMDKQKKYIKLAKGKDGFRPKISDIKKFKKLANPSLYKTATSSAQINLWFSSQ